MENEGRVPAVEIFVVDALGSSAIQEGTFEKIPQIIESSEEFGSKSFNKDFLSLLR